MAKKSFGHVDPTNMWGRQLGVKSDMSYHAHLQKFSHKEFLPEGWYWLLRSKDLRPGKTHPIQFFGKQFVLYRGIQDNQARLLDAHCPHMGAHLCDGKVEGNDIRCPFHNWLFSERGECIEIPVQSDTKGVPPLNSYLVEEKYGLIWLWTGSLTTWEPIPVIPELQGHELDWSLGAEYTKSCHPNVVMINAIDAHHFQSVHHLVAELNMKPKTLSERCIQFSNTTPLPKLWWLRWANRFYKKCLTYELTYWWGHTGSVMVGPDFLHCYIIFALRPTEDGKTVGQTILVTKKRPLGWLLNPVILFLTKLVGNYFAKGDTIIFERIRFEFRTPLRADQAIISFIEHYENLKPSVIFDKAPTPNTAVVKNGQFKKSEHSLNSPNKESIHA